MSQWSYVHGTVVVCPLGRTQAELRYILDTVLAHLPVVSGSERDMDIYTIQKAGHNVSCSCDEFWEKTNNLRSTWDSDRRSRNGWMEMQDQYILVVDGSLRDRCFAETKRAFLRWLCRLAKRVHVSSVQVRISSDDGEMMIADDGRRFSGMFEDPSWVSDNKDREPNWCEYLMWDRAKGFSWPLLLAYKYFADPENDAEAERRMDYAKDS